jgi:hypothetical protein
MHDLTGRSFGRLTAQWPAGIDRNRNAHWLCLCTCGNLRTINGHSLRLGLTRSCGCLQVENGSHSAGGNAIHGHARRAQVSREYQSWLHMTQRCANPKRKDWKRYGGRGITVCERWMRFENFLADVGSRPPGMSLDRFPDNNGNYEPGNVRWATPKQQAGNRRKARS